MKVGMLSLMIYVMLAAGAGLSFGLWATKPPEPPTYTYPEGTYFAYKNFDMFEIYDARMIDGVEYHVLRMIRADFDMPPQGAIFGQLVPSADIEAAIEDGTIERVERDHTP